MNIHEYQAKSLLENYGIKMPRGICIEDNCRSSIDNAIRTFKDNEKIVVKAQIHAGGRGKGTFLENGQHGVQVVNFSKAKEAIASMFNNTLVTKQTGDEGKIVRRIYLTEAVNVKREFYVSFLIDRTLQCPVVVASSQGGGDIEEVAKTNPESIIKISIDPLLGLRPFQARKIAYLFELNAEAMKECVQMLIQLYNAFVKLDASLIEINPLVLTEEDHIYALDAKIQLDDNAIGRHPEYLVLDDPYEKDPKEVEAANVNLNYVALQGNIACLVNGAGLAMATMDIIRHFGGVPANFLDVGGGAKQEQIEAAFRIILKDPHVKGIFINIFGGILKCDMLAQGIVNAAKTVQLMLPLVVRMKGTNVEEARKILNESGLALIPIDDLAQAAETIVNKIKEVSL